MGTASLKRLKRLRQTGWNDAVTISQVDWSFMTQLLCHKISKLNLMRQTSFDVKCTYVGLSGPELRHTVH